MVNQKTIIHIKIITSIVKLAYNDWKENIIITIIKFMLLRS